MSNLPHLYDPIHKWLRRKYGKPDRCEANLNHYKNLNWCNISGKYLRDRDDFVMLCKRCHFYFDRSKVERERIFEDIKKNTELLELSKQKAYSLLCFIKEQNLLPNNTSGI